MTESNTIIWAVIMLSAYLLGGIPTGLLFTRLFRKIDIRKFGSGNIGATNVARVVGLKVGLLTLGVDMLKGALPVGLGMFFLHGETRNFLIGLIALGAIAGHLFPLYLKFKGGKGVATAAGAFFSIAPAATGLALLVFITAVWLSKRVSVGSLTATLCLPVAVWLNRNSLPLTICAGVTAFLIWWRHKDNLKRLRKGREPLIGR